MKKKSKSKRRKPRNPLVALMRLTRKHGPIKNTRKVPDWKDWEREEGSSKDLYLQPPRGPTRKCQRQASSASIAIAASEASTGFGVITANMNPLT